MEAVILMWLKADGAAVIQQNVDTAKEHHIPMMITAKVIGE